ncbi:MAG: hypothetical protein ACLQMT_01365, partial [Candidatus Acidiferrales bacterium]
SEQPEKRVLVVWNNDSMPILCCQLLPFSLEFRWFGDYCRLNQAKVSPSQAVGKARLPRFCLVF